MLWLIVDIIMFQIKLFRLHKKSEINNLSNISIPDERDNLYKTLDVLNFDKYLILRGEKLSSVEIKLNEYGQLPAKGNECILQFAKSQLGEWTIIKLPTNNFGDLSTFHDVVNWFIGYPPKDTNYADCSIGLAIDKSEQQSYLVYTDNSIKNTIEIGTDLFCIFQSDEKYILNPPFCAFKPTNKQAIKDFQSFFKFYNIDIYTIKSNILSYSNFDVLINDL